MPLTTMKIPVELRDRISRNAKARGVSAAELLTQLLDERERQERVAAVGTAFSTLSPVDDYWQEVHDWDAIGSGLPA